MFNKFAEAVKKQFDELSKSELFVTVNGQSVYDTYLASFPAGTDPIYKTRSEHDCSTCKNFLRNVGNVVAVAADGSQKTVWDIQGLEYPYNEVAKKLSEHVRSVPISGLFRVSERKFGAQKTTQLLDGTETIQWNHFYANIAGRHFSANVDTDRGNYATAAQVFKRGLTELKADAFQTVIELIDGNLLYRGAEHLASLKAFQITQRAYFKLSTEAERQAFVWASAGTGVARFRNTVIGTLIQDISGGAGIEAAVRAFESKVAPTNYKRPTSLITPSMVKDAMKTIKELDMEHALERRFARLADVSVNNVLWVDNSVQGKMKDGVEGLLMGAANAARTQVDQNAKHEEISIDDFMANILPQATSMEVLVRNTLVNNFMSITAPVHEDATRLFKWDNPFAWSYEGNITDSIKEKVKMAGGNVTNARLRVSLAWHNFDDLDIHAHEPGRNGRHIYFGNRYDVLDVDMNAVCGTTREPVENLSWTTLSDGVYSIKVNQFSQRETSNIGFELEVENEGRVEQFTYSRPARGMTDVLSITIKGGRIQDITPAAGVTGGLNSKDVWGIKTESFVKVNTVMKSPNHWDGNQVGNKHWFFILADCKNEEPTRGIYNEFLNPELEKHRKVFEILGDKTKCQPTEEQLSGIGFSSTKGDVVTVNVVGTSIRKSYNVKF